MKKTIKIGAVVAGLLGAVQLASAQGYVDLNTYDSSIGAFQGSTSTPAPISGGTLTYFELMGGASAGSLAGVVSDTTGSAINAFTDANGNGAGSGVYVDVGNGPVAGVAGGGTGFFQVLMWEQAGGTPNFANHTFAWESSVWSQAVGNPGTVAPPGPPTPTALAIAMNNPVIGSVASVPGGGFGAILATVPEPSIMALGGLGAAALMAFRRKK
ncbi:MAG TPA: PEP-CTERM sorting domain-containing protein [Verrucomicrobiae bacterium]|jgi:hypothetical protein|nr:PEP-CTERM sorting domain-containing protein [Verrucomicrobiae bacterium]